MNEFVLGIIGGSLIILFFILNQMKVVSVDSRVYDFGNALGAFLLFVYAWSLNSWPFMIINFIWFVFSFKDLLTKPRN